MREDPGYCAEEIKDWSEHRNDRLPDTNGQPHPTGPHTVDFWHRVIRNVMSESVSCPLFVVAFLCSQVFVAHPQPCRLRTTC